MRIAVIKIFYIILFSLLLSACNGHSANGNLTENQEADTFQETLEEVKSIELDDITDSPVHLLNNLATSFDEYLYINSMYADLVFFNKDEDGYYHSWQMPEDLFLDTIRVRNIFKYNNKQIVCICTNDKGSDEIIIYNMDLSIKSRKEIGYFVPKYLNKNLLYGYSSTQNNTIIKEIDLESLFEKDLFSYENGKRINFIINKSGKIIITENVDGIVTYYYEYRDESLFLFLKTNLSTPILYDSRGLYYLVHTDSTSQMNLMLWNEDNSEKVRTIKIDDMDEWLFSNGIYGNVIIENNFLITIHNNSEEPYFLIQPFDSNKDNKILLKKWIIKESDIERNGETFSGIYYENGEIINYFFSIKEGLQTQVLNVKKLLVLNP